MDRRMVALRIRNRSPRYCGEAPKARGPRDAAMSGYLLRENPWLQLRAKANVRCCPDSDQGQQRSEMTRGP
jgi:hypothetical protein